MRHHYVVSIDIKATFKTLSLSQQSDRPFAVLRHPLFDVAQVSHIFVEINSALLKNIVFEKTLLCFKDIVFLNEV